MQKHLSADIEAGQALDRAMFARHRNMSHPLSRLGAEALHDQFVVPPHRAVEEHQRGARQARFQIVGHPRAGGKKIKILAAGLVQNSKPQRVARGIAAFRMRLAFEIPRTLAGHREGQDFHAGRRAVGQGRLERRVHLDRPPLHVVFAEYVKDAVGSQNRKDPLMGVEREGRALAHRQQPRDRIDLTIGQDHAGNRAMPELAFLRMKLRDCDHLLAQVGGGVDQVPMRSVGADRDRGLGAAQFGIFVACLPAHLASAIPLRNTAACRGAEDDDAKHDPSPGASKPER